MIPRVDGQRALNPVNASYMVPGASENARAKVESPRIIRVNFDDLSVNRKARCSVATASAARPNPW